MMRPIHKQACPQAVRPKLSVKIALPELCHTRSRFNGHCPGSPERLPGRLPEHSPERFACQMLFLALSHQCRSTEGV